MSDHSPRLTETQTGPVYRLFACSSKARRHAQEIKRPSDRGVPNIECCRRRHHVQRALSICAPVSIRCQSIHDPDAKSGQVLDAQKNHLIGIERILLETICFNFHLRQSLDADSSETASDVFTHVMRIGRARGASRSFVYLAHLLAIDIHRTYIPLSYPAHALACAMLYLSSYLNVEHIHAWQWRADESPAPVSDLPTFEPGWASTFSVTDDVIDGSFGPLS